MDEAAEEFTGPETTADGLGPIFNAAGCGECHLMPILGGSSQITERRAGFFNGIDLHRSSRRLADPGSRHAPEHPGARAPRPQRDRAARLAERARRRLRRGDRLRRSARHLELAAVGAARHVHPGPGARSARPESRRPLRLEEPARQPAVVLGRRLHERDGHHQPARAGREHVQRRRARARVRSASRAGRRWRGRRAVRAVHARDESAAGRCRARGDGGRAGGQHAVQPDRLRHLPRARTSRPRRRER